jgi:hypothetical protein
MLGTQEKGTTFPLCLSSSWTESLEALLFRLFFFGFLQLLELGDVAGVVLVAVVSGYTPVGVAVGQTAFFAIMLDRRFI